MASCDRIVGEDSKSAGSEGLEEIGNVVSEVVGTEDKSILAKQVRSEGRWKRVLASGKGKGDRWGSSCRKRDREAKHEGRGSRHKSMNHDVAVCAIEDRDESSQESLDMTLRVIIGGERHSAGNN